VLPNRGDPRAEAWGRCRPEGMGSGHPWPATSTPIPFS
jgi:hypothetical protein